MIKVIMTMDSVEVVQADQCQYDNLVTFGLEKGLPSKKPTKFMSNASELLKILMKRCDGQHGWCSAKHGKKHAECSGRKAKEAAKYSD